VSKRKRLASQGFFSIIGCSTSIDERQIVQIE